MGESFSFEEFDDEGQPEDQAQQFLDELAEPAPTEESLDEQMSEVELRLEKAYYYKLLLSNNPFDSDSPIAAEVWKDLSKIIRSRLSELLGMAVAAAPVQAKQFTDEEVIILKSITDKLKKKPGLMDSKPAPKKPTLRKVAAPEAKPLVKVPENKPGIRRVSDGTTAPAPAQAAPKQRGIGRKKVYKTVTTEDGKTVKMDVTPQAKPEGRIQPMATPSIDLSNAHATQQGAQTGKQFETLVELVKAQG